MAGTSPNEFLRAFLAGETFQTLSERYGLDDNFQVEQLLREGLKTYCPSHRAYTGASTPPKDCPVCLNIYEKAVKAKIERLRKERAERRKKR